jgi:hypothetical protein
VNEHGDVFFCYALASLRAVGVSKWCIASYRMSYRHSVLYTILKQPSTGPCFEGIEQQKDISMLMLPAMGNDLASRKAHEYHILKEAS